MRESKQTNGPQIRTKSSQKKNQKELRTIP